MKIKKQSQLLTIKNYLKKHNFPQNLPDYSSQEYWNVRYNQQEGLSFDWYVSFDLLKPYLIKLIAKDDKVLQVGSGSSKLLEGLAQEGFKNLTSSDFSRSLVHQKKQLLKYDKDKKLILSKTAVDFIFLDLSKSTSLGQGSFDVILEKAVLDCFDFETTLNSVKLIKYLLKKNGFFLSISCLRPQKRLKYLRQFKVQILQLQKQNIEVLSEVDTNKYYYLYVCQNQ